MNNIMIDIETLGKKRGCPVLSIAAVQFDLQTGNVGETFYERMSCDAALTYGLPEISTLEWWDKQSAEARDAAFNGERHPVSVAAQLRAFLLRAGGGRCIPWGNGSVFDITILEGWFDRVDPQVDAKGDDIYPWKFWDIADLRTLVRLSGINVKAIPFAGEKHNALADALHQVKIAHAAYSALPSPNRGAQPVAWTDWEELAFRNDMACMWTKGMGINEVPLYTTPPAVPDGWVSCSERMPEPNKYVQVSNGVWVGIGMYNDADHLENDERWQDEHQQFIDQLYSPVTHWMPLSAPPVELKDEK